MQDAHNTEDEMATINTRTRIEVRWNNSIEYVNGAKNIMEQGVDYCSTPRMVLNYLNDLRQKHGTTYYAVALTVAKTGERVSKDDLRQVVMGY
jgi:hypothetical protein